jgi:hypothetical protein
MRQEAMAVGFWGVLAVGVPLLVMVTSELVAARRVSVRRGTLERLVSSAPSACVWITDHASDGGVIEIIVDRPGT